MKIFSKSVAGGMVIVTILFFALEVLDWLILRRGSELSFIERNPAGWLLELPLPLLESIFPPDYGHHGAMLKLSPLGLIAALLFNVFVYSLLARIFLWGRAKRSYLS